MKGVADEKDLETSTAECEKPELESSSAESEKCSVEGSAAVGACTGCTEGGGALNDRPEGETVKSLRPASGVDEVRGGAGEKGMDVGVLVGVKGMVGVLVGVKGVEKGDTVYGEGREVVDA